MKIKEKIIIPETTPQNNYLNQTNYIKRLINKKIYNQSKNKNQKRYN